MTLVHRTTGALVASWLACPGPALATPPAGASAGAPARAPAGYRVKTIGYEMVGVPAGEFQMGCPIVRVDCQPSAAPPHRVVLTRALWVGATEVTWGQWRAIMDASPTCGGRDQVLADEDDRPVQCATWMQAVEFLNQLSLREGLEEVYVMEGHRVRWDREANGYRLPTEAEWEHLARAGTPGMYAWGDLPDADEAARYAWFYTKARSYPTPQPVGRLAPNAWGVHDTVGNVWEWCWDWYAEDAYAQADADAPGVDPTGPATGILRVTRGGHYDVILERTAVTTRSALGPQVSSDGVGFRIVRTVPPER